MYPNIFEIVSADAGVIAALGPDPIRFWPFGLAPQAETRPYAVHQAVFGSPENSLSCVPDIDHCAVQVDVYARSVTETRTVAAAVRDALELDCHMIAHNGESWEQDTGLFRVGMTFEFWTPRG